MNKDRKQATVIIVTGLSGAGKSSALKVLEDIGYFCIDNLPVAFLTKFIELSGNFSPSIKGIALVMDLREEGFLKSFPDLYRRLKNSSVSLDLIFLEADDQTLIKRYSETRRKHPVSIAGSVARAVARERELLIEIRTLASYRIDSSSFTIHQFKDYLRKIVTADASQESLNISLLSFGFRNGLPLEADIVMDVRFLPNPYFIESLREQSGLDPGVEKYVLGHPVSRSFVDRFQALLKMLIPEYLREGKSYLTVAIGCTGGQHRSVAIVNHLSNSLQEDGYEISISHRDIKKI
ncbi:MAG: RNase adapter RapZ [Deltaproteobacteria bacterium]|nr:RNase adapter RapZ [Candidatus Tharpella sp.]